jgi:drug/metabolite transporter (DMT)-like permease
VELYVFFAVLAAAVMHASWNAIIKIGADRTTAILLLALIQSAIAVLILPFIALPLAAAWPWILLSAALHTGYKLLLIRSYEHGDLSQVYPLARGGSPLIVAIFGALFLNEAVTANKAIAIGAIGLGVMMMSLRGGELGAMPRKTFWFTLGTAFFTASYTLVDGFGARIAGDASSFIFWMFACDGLLMVVAAIFLRGRAILPALRDNLGSGLLAGVLSLGSYWIAIWAFTLAPIALVAALREASVLFAMLIAVFWLGEKANVQRGLAAGLILAGILLIRL